MSAIYIDSSAFVKLIVREPGSDDVRDFLAGERGRYVSSALLRTEALRAAGRHGAEALAGARAGLRRLDLIAIDDDILDAAGVLEPGIVRSLDAIHVATALTLGDDLEVLVTFDERMVAASASLGIPTATPG